MPGLDKKRTTRKSARLSGIIEITRKGTGFLPHQSYEQDVEIPNDALGGALNGDEVEVEITGMTLPRGKAALRGPMRPRGEVVRVIARARETFVCTLQENAGRIVAVPDDPHFYRPILLKTPPQEIPGEKVLVRLISFTGKRDPEGVVEEKLGAAGEHRTEMNAIVLEHGFATVFPSDVVKEAQDIAKRHRDLIAAEIPHRHDFRETTTFTIDPVDAKDFDDALSIKKLENGHFEIGIHIADASFFVEEGTTLDREAQKRGTSVYLVDATIPMLPHELSNDICSLKEGEDRLAFSAVFELDENARICERRFERTIIRSNKRFTYEEAQTVLDSTSGPFLAELQMLRNLGRKLKGAREEEGAIDFGEREYRFTLDEEGRPLAVIRKERLETNSLIEEFMLLANREVAHHVAQLAEKVPEKNLVFLYRIHDEPKEDRIEELATFVRALGYDFGDAKKRKYAARDIRKLLKDIEGSPEEALVRTATLRSMAKAIYTTKNIGHFGLAFEYYTHFTSPIRRYPDILVHRILASHLNGKPITRREYANLETLCIGASQQEAKATDAERASIRYKQVEFMTQKVGEAFEGIVSGVTDWGLYVEIPETGAEGLVRVGSIGNDFYEYRPKEYALIGQRSNKKLALGDRVRVKLVSADLSNRQLDFELA